MNHKFDDQLLVNYLRFERKMFRYHAWKHEQIREDDPCRAQQRILSLLMLQSKMTIKEVSFVLGIHPKLLKKVVKKMQDKDWIMIEWSQREQEEESKTSGLPSTMKLTEAGRAEATDPTTSKPQSLFDVLSDEEREQFATLIEKIGQAADEALPAEARQDVPHGEGPCRNQSRGQYHGHDYGGAYGHMHEHGELRDHMHGHEHHRGHGRHGHGMRGFAGSYDMGMMRDFYGARGSGCKQQGPFEGNDGQEEDDSKAFADF